MLKPYAAQQVVTVTHELTNAHLAGDGFVPNGPAQMLASVALQMAFECLSRATHFEDMAMARLQALEYLQAVIGGKHHA